MICSSSANAESPCGSVSSVQDIICALGNAHMRSGPSVRRFPNIALETVPMLVWLTMAGSSPLKEDRRAHGISFYLSLIQL